MRVAAYQCDAAGLDKQQRLALIETVITKLGQGGADLLVCPELFMSGYNVGALIAERAEPVDGAFADAVGGLARKWGMAVVYGYPEAAGAERFNSAIAIGPDGERLANHRKLALPPGHESDWFDRGGSLTLFELGGRKAALAVCYDAEFPETVRAAALAGAELVLVPTALEAAWGMVAHKMMPTRALENGVFLVYANHAGREGQMSYLGASCILAPDGSDLARAGAGEEVIVADLDFTATARARADVPYLDDRPAVFR